MRAVLLLLVSSTAALLATAVAGDTCYHFLSGLCDGPADCLCTLHVPCGGASNDTLLASASTAAVSDNHNIARRRGGKRGALAKTNAPRNCQEAGGQCRQAVKGSCGGDGHCMADAGACVLPTAMPLGPQPLPPAFPPVWPRPRAFTNGSATAVLSAAIEMTPATNADATLVAAYVRFQKRTFRHGYGSAVPGVTSLSISVADTMADLQLYVDESYNLTVSADGKTLVIAAVTYFGAYHGLETLSQLITYDFDNQWYAIAAAPWTIQDAPRFPHRGVLIDSSRHFEPIETIMKVIDSVAMAKFNAIHWHIVDAQSFPYQSTSYPNLGKKSAYSKQERFTMMDIGTVVSYAKARGVRVMVEFDTPGHSASMCAAYPDVCPKPGCPSANVNNWALDITNPYAYEVVEGVLNEFITFFPENLVHLGGDEVDTYCWSLHPYILAWLQARNLTLDGGYEYWVKKIQDYVWNNGPGKEVVGWQEIWDHFGTQLNNRTIIQQWLPNSVALPKNVTSHGYRLIWSDSSVWYLDHLNINWSTMYAAEPCNGLTDDECALILGGEACMWGETVDTSDILQTIWPRAAAVAERLWSPRSALAEAGGAAGAHGRLHFFRCLLNQRSVPAAPVDNSVARSAPPQPGGCYWQ